MFSGCPAFRVSLKLSVDVMGPGDRQKVHDLAEEMQVYVYVYK